jgi:hypothetical protein
MVKGKNSHVAVSCNLHGIACVLGYLDQVGGDVQMANQKIEL